MPGNRIGCEIRAGMQGPAEAARDIAAGEQRLAAVAGGGFRTGIAQQQGGASEISHQFHQCETVTWRLGRLPLQMSERFAARP